MQPPAEIVIAVQTPEIGRVKIRRHALDLEAARLSYLAGKVGRRLKYWLLQMPEQVPAWYRTSSGELLPVIDKETGQQLQVTNLPDGDWRENFRWYQAAVLGLLKEQRERAKLAPHARPPIGDDDFDAELQDLAREAIRTMPEDELRRLLQERGAIDVANTDQVAVDEEI